MQIDRGFGSQSFHTCAMVEPLRTGCHPPTHKVPFLILGFVTSFGAFNFGPRTDRPSRWQAWPVSLALTFGPLSAAILGQALAQLEPASGRLSEEFH